MGGNYGSPIGEDGAAVHSMLWITLAQMDPSQLRIWFKGQLPIHWLLSKEKVTLETVQFFVENHESSIVKATEDDFRPQIPLVIALNCWANHWFVPEYDVRIHDYLFEKTISRIRRHCLRHPQVDHRLFITNYLVKLRTMADIELAGSTIFLTYCVYKILHATADVMFS